MKTIQIQIDNQIHTISRTRYIRAKTKQLRDFGYKSLTEETVAQQLDKILSGNTDLDVIGKFMEGEVIPSK